MEIFLQKRKQHKGIEKYGKEREREIKMSIKWMSIRENWHERD